MLVRTMADLGTANLSEAKRALLQKYLQGELTLNRTRRFDTGTETIQPSAIRSRPADDLDLTADVPLPLLFEAQVKRTPGAIAAVYEDCALTYEELNRKANQLAHHLQRFGVGPESLVGLAVNRSLDMLVGALGIMKAGGAYVPLDPLMPRERLRYMIDDARLSIFVTQAETAGLVDVPAARNVRLDADLDRIGRENVENPAANLSPKTLAYATYTSGSTGNPKGVLIEHGALSNFLVSMLRRPGLASTDILVAVTTLSFDISVLELFLPLICGGRVIIASREATMDGRLLQDLLATSRATVMQATPATWRLLIDAGWQGDSQLRVLCGGEALPQRLADQLLKRCGELWNMYGPTETTIWSSLCKIETSSAPITIGSPIANTQFYVLDENLRPAAPAEIGELYIGGAGLARGYLNCPELMSERFIVKPSANASGARLYKTGDLVRVLPDSGIEFVGRRDSQIKLRGFRIELGEIERALSELAEISEAVVVLHEDRPGDQRLVGYVVTNGSQSIDARELRRRIAAKLPDHMVPSAIVQVERLPLTANGKTDRQALAGAGITPKRFAPAAIEPRGETEEVIAAIWCEVLNLKSVGLHENFFELGGNSLLAGSMLARLRDRFETDLTIRAIFAAPHIASLAREIDRDQAAKKIAPAGAPSASRIRLSFSQERLWFLDQLNPGSAAFNIPLAARLRGPIVTSILRRSVQEIVGRHEVLRTVFPNVNGEPAPFVSAKYEVDLPVIDLTTLAEVEREARAREIVHQETLCPFDLAQGPLLRTTLVRLTETDSLFLVTMHHIASDGWSMVLFFDELSKIYEAFSRNGPSPLKPLKIQYSDYAAWQREWLTGEMTQRQLSYWKEKLGGELPALDLPADRPRPNVQTFRGARKWLELSETQTRAINELCKREGGTLFMVLLSAFKVLLNRYTGQEDIIVGAPIAARPLTETEELIGFFLNNLALRTDISGDPTFRELLGRVRQTALEAFANQEVPFEKLIEEIRPRRDLSRTPIFQVYFNLFNFTGEMSLPGGGDKISFVEAWSQSEENFSKFDLTFCAGMDRDRLKFAMVYNIDLFDEPFIARMLSHFESLVNAIIADPAQPISGLSLSEAHRVDNLRVRTDVIKRQAEASGRSFTPFERSEIEESITRRFERQVEKSPGQTAIKSRRYQWTYAELDAIANRIKQALALASVESSQVALLFDHDAPMIAAMLGTLKAAKTYVPMDPKYPAERLSWILDNARANVLLTNNRNLALAEQLIGKTVQLINIDVLATVAGGNDLSSSGPESLAYILYTSGSTGQPKGVMQSHRNVLHFIRVYTNNLRIGADDRLTLLSSYCFDASVMDIYGALLNGATLYPIDIREDGLAGLAEQIRQDEITIFHSTPTVFRYFIDALKTAQTLAAGHSRQTHCQLPLRLVVLGGEEVLRRDVEAYREHFSDDCVLVNGLGPTEATVALQNVIDKETVISSESVPVGYPVDDTEVLLLNDRGRPVEVQGEIAIKCEHIALGYWRNPEATTAAFSNGLATKPGENRSGELPEASRRARLYRTGDLGRRLPDGSIRFEGRKDLQVKIRGYRVELGEIESILAGHRQVRECAVVAGDIEHQEKQLIAYVVPHLGPSPSESDLRNFLKQRLPDYMLPAAFVMLKEFPLTASGKINRLTLPPAASLRSQPARIAKPQTTLESLLLEIWSDVLGVPLGVDDNFFEYGGHSLMAVRLFAEIEKRLGHRFPLAVLFQAPTVAQLADVIERDSDHHWTSLVPIQPKGGAAPFFCVHGLGGNVLEFYDLARHLGPEQPFYGLQSQGLQGKQPPHTTIGQMAAHYLKELREVQPHGPYLIGGRSLGGTIAFEMACQLRAQGEEISLLALLDAYPSGYAKLLPAITQPETRFGRAANRIENHFRNLRRLTVAGKISYLFSKARYAPQKVKSFVWRRIHRMYGNLNRDLPRLLRDVAEFNSLAARNYTPQSYDGKVTLFWASGDLRAYDVVEGWRVLASGGVEVHEVPGNHLNIVKEPHVADLARKLSRCLIHAQNPRGATNIQSLDQPELKKLGRIRAA